MSIREHPIVYSPHLWDELVKTLNEALRSTNDGDRVETIPELVNRLYIMFLDAKYRTGSGNNLRKTWTSLVEIMCSVLRRTLGSNEGITLGDEVNVSSVPLRVLQNLSRDLPFSRDLGLRYETVISFLCDHIECSKSEVRSSELCLKEVVSVVNCLTTWCIEYEDIMINRQTLLRCLQVLELWTENSCLSWIISEKYQYLLKHLCDSPSGTGYFYSKFCERDLAEEWKLKYPNQYPNQYPNEGANEGATVKYLLFESSTILCLINPPKANNATNTPLVYLVVRGPYLELSFYWFRYEHDPLTRTSVKDREKVPRPRGKGSEEDNHREEEIPVPRLSVVLEENPENADDGIVTVPSIQETLRHGDNSNFVKEYVTEKELTELIEEQKRACDSLSEPPPPGDLQSPDCVKHPDSSRLFLAHLGILSPEMFHSSGPERPPVVLLKDSFKLQKMLKELDGIWTRECQTVMVLYMKTGQKTLEQILKNTNILVPNQRFQRFVSSLGNEIVDICSFKGWTGLRACDDGTTVNAPVTFPYYSDRCNEVVFSIPNLLPPKVPDTTRPGAGSIDRTRVMCQEDLLKNTIWDAPVDCHIQSNIPKMIIVWAESPNDILSFTFENVASHLKCDEDSRFSITFVSPLSGGFVRVLFKDVSKEGGSTVGGGYVVRDYISHIVIREQCLAVRESGLLDQLSPARPLNRRQALIDKIVKENGCADQENGYFNCFFNRH